jgi:RNA polymerase sigma factor (sigma-70 family)
MPRRGDLAPAVRTHAERNRLAEDNAALLRWAFKRTWERNAGVRCLDPEEAEQVAWIAFLRAADLWEEPKGNLSTYVEAAVRHALLGAAKAQHLESLRLPAQRVGSYRLWGLLARARPARDAVADLELAELLERALRRLPRREALALRGKFFEGRTLREVAGELGVSHQRVVQLQESGLERLRRHLAGRGLEACV